MRNKGFNAPYFKSSVDRQKELFNVVNNVPHYYSCLIYGVTGEGKILHVQCSIDPVWIVTAYDPTLHPEEWDREYKKRRKKS
jgi:hypothetical protein